MLPEQYVPQPARNFFDMGDNEYPPWDLPFSIELYKRLADFNSDFPSLEDVFAADDLDDLDPVFTRFMLTPYAHIPIDFPLEARKQAQEQGLPIAVVRHMPVYTTSEYQEELCRHEADIVRQLGPDTHIGVLKTVTIAFPVPSEGIVEPDYQIVLFFGLGDFRIEKEDKRSIARAIGLENWSAKRAILNPSTDIFDPTTDLHLIPGLVKPIFGGSYRSNIAAICLKVQEIHPDSFVAVTVSPYDSIILPVSVFTTSFREYCNKNYPGAEETSADGITIRIM